MHIALVKGEVTGSEDLFVDGLVDGKLNLTNGSLTVGPNGTVKADVYAREVIVRGKIEGKVTGREKVQLWSTGQVLGEVQTDRLAIEEGALLKGKVEAGKQPAKPSETKAAVAVATKTSDTAALSSGTSAACAMAAGVVAGLIDKSRGEPRRLRLARRVLQSTDRRLRG
jgi:cytoskeletal protein CcmA (bactofilin family)